MKKLNCLVDLNNVKYKCYFLLKIKEYKYCIIELHLLNWIYYVEMVSYLDYFWNP